MKTVGDRAVKLMQEMPAMSPAAELAMKLILDDMADRRGALAAVWDQIDEDVRDEVCKAWAKCIDTAIRMDLEWKLSELGRRSRPKVGPRVR